MSEHVVKCWRRTLIQVDVREEPLVEPLSYCEDVMVQTLDQHFKAEVSCTVLYNKETIRLIN